MSKILEVLNKKSVELKSEVVEFALADDLEVRDKKISKRIDIINGKGRILAKVAEQKKGKISTIDLTIRNQEAEIEKTKKQAKDLGVEIPELSRWQKELDDFKKRVKAL